MVADDDIGTAEDEYVHAAEDLGDVAEDEGPPVTHSRGSVGAATWRRARVPYQLRDVITARVDVERAERELARRVKSARGHGATWEELGLALGMSRQGVAKRYG